LIESATGQGQHSHV